KCATSRRSEMLDGPLEDPPSDNAARSLLPALTTAPPPPSPLETRRASCASSCPHNLASRSSAARPCCPLESKAQCAMIRRLIRGSLTSFQVVSSTWKALPLYPNCGHLFR